MTAKENMPMDFDEALEEFVGNKMVLDGAIEKFLAQVAGQIVILQEAIINKDFETIRTEAHKIKGGAANLTAMLLSEVAADLEQKGKDVQGEGIEEKMVVFKEEFQRLKEYVENDYK